MGDNERRNTLSIRDNRTGRDYEVDILDGDVIRSMDLRQIKVDESDFGMMAYDPGFTNTASTRNVRLPGPSAGTTRLTRASRTMSAPAVRTPTRASRSRLPTRWAGRSATTLRAPGATSAPCLLRRRCTWGWTGASTY